MLRSDLCNYSDAYTAMKGRISVTGANNAKKRKKKLTFKNNAPFRSFMTKINKAFIDNANDLDIVLPMYNLLDYSDNYSMTSGSLRNFYGDEVKENANENYDARNYRIKNNKTATS